MANNKSGTTVNLLLKEDVDKILSSKEDIKALWKVIFDKFESGGEPLAKALINERLNSLENQINLDRYTPQLCCGWDKPSNNF